MVNTEQFNIRNDHDDVTAGNEEKLVVVKTVLHPQRLMFCSQADNI